MRKYHRYILLILSLCLVSCSSETLEQETPPPWGRTAHFTPPESHEDFKKVLVLAGIPYQTQEYNDKEWITWDEEYSEKIEKLHRIAYENNYYTKIQIAKIMGPKEKYLTILIEGAEYGDIWAQNSLGIEYVSGILLPKDYAKGLYWYTKAADSGDPYAMSNIAILYQNGWGVEKSLNKAFAQHIKAANAGASLSMCEIARYQNEKLVDPNPDLPPPEYWIKTAKEQHGNTCKSRERK